MFESKTGTVMCISLFSKSSRIHVLVAYEDGRVALFSHAGAVDYETPSLDENAGWKKVVEFHEHKEPSKDTTCMLIRIPTKEAFPYSHGTLRGFATSKCVERFSRPSRCPLYVVRNGEHGIPLVITMTH